MSKYYIDILDSDDDKYYMVVYENFRPRYSTAHMNNMGGWWFSFPTAQDRDDKVIEGLKLLGKRNDVYYLGLD